MDNPELHEYIQDKLRQGETKQYIRTTLRANGWPDKIVDGAFQLAANTPRSSGAAVSGSSGETLPKIAPLSTGTNESTRETVNARTKRIVSLIIFTCVVLIVVAMIFAWRNIDHNSSSAKTKQDTSLKSGVNDLATRLTSYYAAKQTYPAAGKLISTIDSSTAQDYSYQAFSSTGDVCNGKTIPCTRVIISTKLSTGSRYLVVLDHNTESH